MFVLDSNIASVLSILLVIVGIALLILVISFVGRFLIKLIVGLIVNTILGFIVLLIVKYVFGVAIGWTWPVIISVALFGLPAVGTILILKIIGGFAFLVAL